MKVRPNNTSPEARADKILKESGDTLIFPLHRLKGRIAEEIREAVNDALAFFGAKVTEDGGLEINMPKYHSVHRCDKHREAPWDSETYDVCMPCVMENK